MILWLAQGFGVGPDSIRTGNLRVTGWSAVVFSFACVRQSLGFHRRHRGWNRLLCLALWCLVKRF